MKRWMLLFLVLFSGNALARDLTPTEEARFNQLGREIRCVVCQSEPVATSSAKIAIDMRDVIKERIEAGDDDNQIRKYFADHYGEYVLLRPQVNNVTYLLWFAPILLLLIGGFVILRTINNRTIGQLAPQVLSEEELLAAEKILDSLKDK